jgi:hypothetical protein
VAMFCVKILVRAVERMMKMKMMMTRKNKLSQDLISSASYSILAV